MEGVDLEVGVVSTLINWVAEDFPQGEVEAVDQGQ